jgi:hypothetical protein
MNEWMNERQQSVSKYVWFNGVTKSFVKKISCLSCAMSQIFCRIVATVVRVWTEELCLYPNLFVAFWGRATSVMWLVTNRIVRGYTLLLTPCELQPQARLARICTHIHTSNKSNTCRKWTVVLYYSNLWSNYTIKISHLECSHLQQ